MLRSAPALLAVALLLAIPASASARPCSDRTGPIVVEGTAWLAYVGDDDSHRKIQCAKARRIAKQALRGRTVPGWRCNRRLQRCVRGGTYVDRFGDTQWRYLIGWIRQD